jgi:eukaryotic-like serine/threonine-protein kinase
MVRIAHQAFDVSNLARSPAMSHQAPLKPGDPRRVGRYRLAERITGIPADGPIYLGTGPGGGEVMISMVPGNWARDSAARDRFTAEAAVARRVPPFCAARILDAGIDGDRAYLVSEYVPGESLFELVSARGVLPEGEIEAVAIGMATGLASVHQAGLVHGSFGPEFVIMTDAGPRVVEFAITPPYGTATPSADMVAWARTVVFAATGRPPATMADLDVLPYYVRDAVAACLNPDPSERPTARAAVLELLGDHDPPAGVLAEGSRRAAPGTEIAARLRLLTAAARTGADRPLPERQARSAPRTSAAGGSPPPAAVPRQASRHGRPAGEVARIPAPADPRAGYRGQPARIRRLALVLAGVVAVVAVVAVGGALLLSSGGGTGNPEAGLSHRPSPTGSTEGRSPLTSQPVAPDLTMPPRFVGHWSGTVLQPDTNDTITASLDLAGGAGPSTVTYVPADRKLECTASLGLTKVVGKTLTLSQTSLTGQHCATGTVTITLTSSGSIRYVFQGNGPAAAGALNKS